MLFSLSLFFSSSLTHSTPPLSSNVHLHVFTAHAPLFVAIEPAAVIASAAAAQFTDTDEGDTAAFQPTTDDTYAVPHSPNGILFPVVFLPIAFLSFSPIFSTLLTHHALIINLVSTTTRNVARVVCLAHIIPTTRRVWRRRDTDPERNVARPFTAAHGGSGEEETGPGG